MESPTVKVLIAEDEPAMLSLVARHMRSKGFNVIEASEGDTALELAEAHLPDLVILDVMMPGMSGWEVCKRIKGPGADLAFANTAVIMLTGIGENLNDLTSPLFAADDWLNKPFDFNELDAKVKETLTRYAKPIPRANGSGASLPPPPKSSHPDAMPARKAKKAAAKPAKKAAAKKAPAKAKPAAKTAVAKKPAAKPAKKPAAKPAKKPAAKKAGKASKKSR